MQIQKNELKRSLSQPMINPINYKNTPPIQGEIKQPLPQHEVPEKDKDFLSILSLINSALNIPTAKNNFSSNNYYRRNDLLLRTKENSIINFLISLQNKNINSLKSEFLSNLDSTSKSAQNKINEFKINSKENMYLYESIVAKNKKILKDISDMNNAQRKLTVELRNSQNLISQIQINDQSLKQYKLLYDEFIKSYPGKDPVKQINEMGINKTTFLNKFKEYNDLQRKLEIEKKEDERRLAQEKKILKNMKEKLNRINESNNIKKIENKLVLEELNTEKKRLQDLKEDNNNYRKMLYYLYIKLLSAFKLNKKININPKFLNISEKDFNPEIMDDLDLFNYIKLMINNINPSIKDKALKQTIAYSNMITRIYLKNKNSLRYDPLNIFKELKSMMEDKEQKIIKLSDKVKDFEIKINNMELENKKLNNLLIHFNQERIKNLSNKSFIRAHKRSSTFKFLKNIQNKSTNHFLFNKNYYKFKRPQTGVNIKHKNFDNDDKEKNSFDNDKIKNKLNMTNNNSTNNINEINKMIKNAKRKWFEESKNMKEFKKIKESRNKDKILKIHNHQPLVKCLNEFNRLIKHTNKLFVYKYKIAPKEAKKININSSKNKSIIEKKSMENIKVHESDEIYLNIENKINNLIKLLQNDKNKSNTSNNIQIQNFEL